LFVLDFSFSTWVSQFHFLMGFFWFHSVTISFYAWLSLVSQCHSFIFYLVFFGFLFGFLWFHNVTVSLLAWLSLVSQCHDFIFCFLIKFTFFCFFFLNINFIKKHIYCLTNLYFRDILRQCRATITHPSKPAKPQHQ
jgi:hypothetical protein